MRLLQLGADGGLTLTRDFLCDIPPYAILSHTWGIGPDDEVTLQDIIGKRGLEKPGYQKILFCGQQARRDSLEYFWVDTCCIDKTSSAELTESINSMFRWYQNAQKCYVYLADVSHSDVQTDEPARSMWKLAFRNSKWFTRGWTLQELIAPRAVEFFSAQSQLLGDRRSLEQTIHEITQIPVHILRGDSVSEYGIEERIRWSENRKTMRTEDRAYSLLGILGVSLPVIYGEGENRAFERLRTEFSMRSAQIRVLAKLPSAEGACFDSHAEEHNSCCLPNTRVDILHEIAEWAHDPHSKTVYWLNGMAGTGKSTISRTLAQKFSVNRRLGATFFFKRGEGDRGGISKLFTTLASQLIQQVPETARHVQAAMDTDPAIVSKTLREQFDKLIMGPVSKISCGTSPGRTRLVVVDALDECEREEDVKVLIKLLSGVQKPKHLYIKFFLTSRPELPIRLGFKAIGCTYQHLILHEVAKSTIEHDIASYFKHELRLIQQQYDISNYDDRQLSANWPAETDLQALIQMAIPLFIFAATVCRFISDNRVGSPDEQLKEILQYQSKSVESQLDATYLPVLNQMIAGLRPRDSAKVLERFHEVVGSIIALYSPLSTFGLAQLLETSVTTVDSTLRTLHSVLSIPISPQQPIRLLHLSFRDFLVDPARRKDFFWINEKERHRQLATQCLRMLRNMKTNICEVQAPGTLATSISSDEIHGRLPPEIQYACRFWIYHLQASGIQHSDAKDVWEFLSSHFLQWLEVLSWIGRLPESLHMVKDLQLLFPPIISQRISDFLSDTVRFILATSPSIQIAPLQAYSSALIFSPGDSIVRSIYNQEIADWINLQPKVPLRWGQNLQTLEGHTDMVSSVAFSPDGKLVASGSGDQTVILWGADTGERQQTLEGHTDGVSSVAFSPDGKLVASASGDQTVILWHIDTGERQQILEGHTDSVYSVAFSPDGKLVASASADRTIILWRAYTGERRQTLKGHTDGVYSVVFSPDGNLVASASGDHTVRLWCTDTGERQQTLEGHLNRVDSVALSPDGKLVASASRDQTVMLWYVDTGERQQTLKDYTNPPASRSDSVTWVSFSPDGKLIASASHNQTVIFWCTDTGERQQTLKGHTDGVSSVAFSPDGQLAASASCDRTVILWRAEAGECPQAHEGHMDWVTSVAFSPDGKLVASASRDQTIMLWHTDTGELQQTLKGHMDWVSSAAFSPDGKLVASASGDRTVILWHTNTGERHQTLKGHTGWVYSVAFSPNGEVVASPSYDQTVILWHVDTGERQQTLEGHTDPVDSVAFSPDGKLVASASRDQTVMLWHTNTGERQQTLKGHTDGVSSVAFSPDGKLVASASRDQTVILWHTDTGELQQTLEGHINWVTSVAFSPDGKLVASASLDQTIMLWHTDTGKRQQKIDIGTTSKCLKFDTNNDHILTDVGTFAIHKPSSTLLVESSQYQPSVRSSTAVDIERVGYGISQDQCWITSGGEMILWLPPAYRPVSSVTRGSTIVIGGGFGNVLIIRLG